MQRLDSGANQIMHAGMQLINLQQSLQTSGRAQCCNAQVNPAHCKCRHLWLWHELLFFFILHGSQKVNKPSLMMIRRQSNDTFHLCKKEGSTINTVEPLTQLHLLISQPLFLHLRQLTKENELKYKLVYSAKMVANELSSPTQKTFSSVQKHPLFISFLFLNECSLFLKSPFLDSEGCMVLDGEQFHGCPKWVKALGVVEGGREALILWAVVFFFWFCGA